jgi:two-component system, chemotaxis family, protein-glutamate methylesterase/glutaminase
VAQVTVLVVDDSFFMRKVLVDILQTDPDIAVVGQAADGQAALRRIDELHPQVVTLDLVMPELNGLQTLARLNRKHPRPAVVMVSAFTTENAEVTLNCLAMGAVDFVLKPSGSVAEELKQVGLELQTKVRVAAKASVPHPGTSADTIHTPVLGRRSPTRRALVIGASTGGPVALEQLLSQFPKQVSYPILVAQHLPAQFVESFAARLARSCPLNIQVGQSGDKVLPGTIYFAPGGAHTQVVRQEGQVVLSVQASDDILTPSVTKLMTSVAHVYGDGTTGVILTGMGEDGLEGMQAIKSAGGSTIVQDEATSVVFGMGRAVVARGLADEVLPLRGIAQVFHG